MNSDKFLKDWESQIKHLRTLKRIDAVKLSLDEWLALLNPDDKENSFFIHWEFPTKAMRDEYLATIQTRTAKEVIDLLRNFLIPSGNLAKDDLTMSNLMLALEQKKIGYDDLTEHHRRLLRSYIVPGAFPWEGNTWVIDLLPQNPKLALDALQAYVVSHFGFLPDGRIDGLLDAMALIRAKFIETSRSTALLDLDPYQFELLIDALYRRMGYITKITQKTYDKGRDVIAERKSAGKKEKLLIQCRRTEKNVGVREVRTLLGVVENEKASKGVFASTSEFTNEARKLENENPRLELIGNKDLQALLNEYLGSDWSIHIDSIISERARLKLDRSPKVSVDRATLRRTFG